MAVKKLWLAPLALVVGAATASPDTLIMDDGRRIRGELISVNRNVVVFDQYDDGFASRARRLRVDRADVRRINLTDDDVFDDDDNVTSFPGTSSGSFGGFDREFAVRGDQQWTDTGLRLRAGENFRVDATGFVNWGPNRSDGPNGEVSSPYNANRPLPNRPGAALIGRIGNGAPFFIGSGGTFRAGNSGRLYLGINDDYLGDNSGTFRVMVDY